MHKFHKLLIPLFAVLLWSLPGTLQAETRDISSHGAFFQTEEQIQEDTKLDIELSLSMDKILELLREKKQVRILIQGTVLRSNAEGIAVSFGRRYQIIQADEENDT